VQTITFVPESAPFDTHLDMLGVTCIPRENDLRVAVEIDRIDTVADDPERDLDFDKQEIPLTFENPDSDLIQSELKATIQQNTDQGW
jgi:sporulation-control protein spo0M